MTKFKSRYTLIASFVAMFILAVTESTRGILIPIYKIEFDVNDAQIGLFLFLASLAFVVGTPFAGMFISKFGHKKGAMTGMAIAGFTFLATSYATSFFQLVLGYTIATFGFSFLLMSLNTIVPLLKLAYMSIIMNMMHFFYGFGATLTQRITGYLLDQNIEWRQFFVAYFVIYMVGFFVFAYASEPGDDEKKKHSGKITNYEIPLITMFSISLGFYITSEIQTSNWLANYLREIYDYSNDQASYYVAFFFGALAIGRIVGGFVLEKIGYLRGVTITLGLALILYVTGLMKEEFLFILSLSGFFFSIVYPTVILVIQRVFKDNTTSAVAIITTSASFISMIMGWLIGVMNEQIGTYTSYKAVPIALGISFVFMILIRIELKRVEKRRTQ